MAQSSRERVAERVQRLADVREAPVTEGVQPLNPGYFEIERMRTQSNPKERAAMRPVLRSAPR